MNVSIISLFPSLYSEFFNTSLLKHAQEKGLASFSTVPVFQLARSGERIDAPVVGHGSGMVIKAEIAEKAFDSLSITRQNIDQEPYVIFFSPHGKKLDQKHLHHTYKNIEARNNRVVLFASRYEGVDSRVEEFYADEILSIGDYVLMGGDLPCMIFLEALLRLVPGIVGSKFSVENDSFENLFLDHPHYADPDIWKGMQIPPILKSGNHLKIQQYREIISCKRTLKNNFEWLKKHYIEVKKRTFIKENIPPHYCALLHNDIMLPNGQSGTSSVTSIDIHDIARSSRTYGIEHYFIITKLASQQALVKQFLSFWHEGKGAEYNAHRCDAVSNVSCMHELEEAIHTIEKKHNKKPLILVTSSRDTISKAPMISYHDQSKVWELDRPVLLVFGTSHGLSPELMDKADFRLLPLEGFSNFNFLSVRSAAAIIFDRWLGINPCYNNKD